MQTYKTLITVRGLRRADPSRRKEPIGEGEVIALPDGYAQSLHDIGAIELTDEDETVELEWKAPVTLVKSDDRERLIEALQALGVSDLPIMPEPSAMPLVGIRPTDTEALAQALEALGALVLLPGEDIDLPTASRLASALKEVGAIVKLQGSEIDDLGRYLDPVSGYDLFVAAVQRVRNGYFDLADLPDDVRWDLAGLLGAGQQTAPPSAPVADPTAVVAPAQEAATAPAKPARKGKA